MKCPHAYFAKYLLHLQPVELPEELIQLSPLDKGNIVHATLDEFLTELRGVDAGLGRPWSDAQRARLHEILDEQSDAIEARGLAGKRLLWARARRELHAQLDVFLDFDAEYRATYGADTLATEFAFGRDGTREAVELRLSDGRSVRVNGSIDRVDRLADGRLAVIDYKSGSTRNYVDVSHDDPLLRGALLQLPIYAHAARAFLGDGGAEPVLAEYWFVLKRAEEAARLRGRRRGRAGARRRLARDHLRYRRRALPGPATRARFLAVHRVRVLRPRRSRHHRLRTAPGSASAPRPSWPTTSR